MKGVRITVILRSLSEGSVLVDMTAGTVHPKPISSGTIERPERPILRRSLSMKNAILAIYPLSSRSERKKNITTTIGRKLNTLPTPSKIPSIIRLCITSFTPALLSPASVSFVRISMPCSRSHCNPAPITLNVRKNTSPMMRIKIGIAVNLPVRIRSIFSDLVRSLDSLGLITACLQSDMM